MNVKDLKEFIKDLPDSMEICIAMLDNNKIRDTSNIIPLIGHMDKFLMIMEDWFDKK